MVSPSPSSTTTATATSSSKFVGINAAQWVEQFIAVFYRKFPDVELRGLFRFMIQGLSGALRTGTCWSLGS